MQQIAPAVFSIVEVEPRAGLYTICYQQRDDAKDCSVSLRRTAKREPFTRQLPSRVTVWAAALVRLRRSAALPVELPFYSATIWPWVSI